MEKLKIFMGFLLAAAVVWLFYVLASQVSSVRLAFIELALLGLALFVWMRHASARPWLRRLAIAGALGCVILTLGLAARGFGEGATRQAESGEGLVDWLTFDRIEAERLVAEEGRMVFVDVTADWCFTCKVNEQLVLETPEIAQAFERHEVVPMKADWTNRNDTIAAYLAEHGRYGVPFYALYRPGGEPHLFSELLTKEAVIDVLEGPSD